MQTSNSQTVYSYRYLQTGVTNRKAFVGPALSRKKALQTQIYQLQYPEIKFESNTSLHQQTIQTYLMNKMALAKV